MLIVHQVRNFMNRHRQAINSVTGADKTAGGVAGWLGEHELSAESGVNDVVAAPGWKVDGDNVLAGLTTKAAIQNAHRAQRRNGGYMLMGIDNTYSLTVHGYPALVSGAFHHVLLFAACRVYPFLMTFSLNMHCHLPTSFVSLDTCMTCSLVIPTVEESSFTNHHFVSFFFALPGGL